MIYRILKIWVKAGYSHYFGKIEVMGMNNVDPRKPAIFAVNHPSAFIEPTLIATQSPFDVHFITRGDVFVKRFKWFFDSTNQVPVFRFKDGFSSLRNNKSSFDKCHEKLIDGAKLLIFCEGSMKWVKRLRPVQQGAAKLAMGTLEKDPQLPLFIHPVGVNYEDHSKPGSDIMVQIGPAIPMADYFEKYREFPREVIRGLTQDIEDALQKCIVHVEKDKDLKLFDSIWSPLQSISILKNGKYSGDLFNRYKTAADWLNGLDDEGRQELKSRVKDYSKKLETVKMRDTELHAFSKMRIWDFLWLSTLGTFLKINFELNKLPYRLARFISKKKTPNVEFYVSVKAVLTTLLYTFFVLGLWIFLLSLFQLISFVVLGEIGSYTNLRWKSMIKGAFCNKKALAEAKGSRKQLLEYLQKNIIYE